MIVLYLILVVLVCFSIRPLVNAETSNPDYISKETTNVIKGVCIWMVFICHVSSYMRDMPFLNHWDSLLYVANHYIRQLLIVPFLFYSGYGVTIAFKSQEGYSVNFFKRRVVTTLLNFDVAVAFFLLLNFFFDFELDVKKTLLSFIGWESLGNSNWYIFCIVFCYILSFVTYKIFGTDNKMLYALVLGVGIYMVIMILCGKGRWWYDTVFAYAAGACFAWWKQTFEVLMEQKYWKLMVFSIFGFLLFYNAPNYYGLSANISAVFLSAIIVLFTYKFKMKNSLLEWSGQHTFPIYIYQRLPMIALSTIAGGSFMTGCHYMYIGACLIVTIIIAFVYKYIKVKTL